ncbi:hypothetical protein ACO1B2_10335 [Staphylococcus saprophyticus]|uniref:hypothetical protein n=1 Tax=Staphylococcus saprophyticus TaxID=29385 RepID=UPI003BF7687D
MTKQEIAKLMHELVRGIKQDSREISKLYDECIELFNNGESMDDKKLEIDKLEASKQKKKDLLEQLKEKK